MEEEGVLRIQGVWKLKDERSAEELVGRILAVTEPLGHGLTLRVDPPNQVVAELWTDSIGEWFLDFLSLSPLLSFPSHSPLDLSLFQFSFPSRFTLISPSTPQKSLLHLTLLLIFLSFPHPLSSLSLSHITLLPPHLSLSLLPRHLSPSLSHLIHDLFGRRVEHE